MSCSHQDIFQGETEISFGFRRNLAQENQLGPVSPVTGPFFMEEGGRSHAEKSAQFPPNLETR